MQAPVALVDLLAVLGLHVVHQRVDVGTLGVGQFAEHALAHHVQGLQLEEVVAAVLQHHAVPAGALAGLDQLPAAVQVQGRRHLDRRVLAVAHGADRHGHVPRPGRADVDQVQVQLAEVAPVLGAGGEFAGRRPAVGRQDFLGLGHALRAGCRTGRRCPRPGSSPGARPRRGRACPGRRQPTRTRSRGGAAKPHMLRRGRAAGPLLQPTRPQQPRAPAVRVAVLTNWRRVMAAVMASPGAVVRKRSPRGG